MLGLLVYCLLHCCDCHHYCYFVVVITIVANVSWSWSPSLLLLCGCHRYCYSMVTIATNALRSPLLLYGHGCHHRYYFMVMVIIIVVFKVLSPSLLFVSWSWSPSLLLFFSWSKVFPPFLALCKCGVVECGSWIGFNSNYIHLGKFFFQCWYFFFLSFFVFLFSSRMFLCAFGILLSAFTNFFSWYVFFLFLEIEYVFLWGDIKFSFKQN